MKEENFCEEEKKEERYVLMKYKTILVIGDTQFEPGKSVTHMKWIGACAADYEVDCVVHMGDYNDHLASSRYDKDKPSKWAGRDIRADYEIGFKANEFFLEGLGKHSPKLHLLKGNHDIRPTSLVEQQPQLEGLIEEYEEKFRRMGWCVHDYQEPVCISGVYYAHMFTRTTSGGTSAMSVRSGASSARAQLQANLVSCTAGHKPGFHYTEMPCVEGTRQSMIVGSCYPHKMKYCGPQGNLHWNGVVIKHMTGKGQYDFERISLKRLKYLYG